MVAICVVIAVHVGFGIEYLEVQNAWALECVLSCWKKTYGTFVHSGPATTCWTTTASAITVAEYSIFFPSKSMSTEKFRSSHAKAPRHAGHFIHHPQSTLPSHRLTTLCKASRVAIYTRSTEPQTRTPRYRLGL